MSRGWNTRRIAQLFVVPLCLLVCAPLAGVGHADTYTPPSARMRPRLGWTCAVWTRRVPGDFNGDGRMDRALLFDRAAPHSICDETQLPERWHVTLFLGSAGRVDRPVSCVTGPSICGLSAMNLDDDRTSELAVTIDGGAAFTDAIVLRLDAGRLRTVRSAGAPVHLTSATDSGDRRGWGCRTDPVGDRVVVTYRGSPVRGGGARRWRFRVHRMRLDGSLLATIGTHVVRVRYHGRFPRTPKVGRCGRFSQL